MTDLKYKFFTVHQMPATSSLPLWARKGDKPKADRPSYSIFSNKDMTRLGWIEWYAPWRQWVFTPQFVAQTVWSKGCLDDVLDAIEKIKAEQGSAEKESGDSREGKPE